MERVHDIGAAAGFGPVDTAEDREPFHHEWEARVFAINSTLLRRKIYTLDEFRNAIERMNREDYRNSSYYERWLHAIETLLVQKGVIDAV